MKLYYHNFFNIFIEVDNTGWGTAILKNGDFPLHPTVINFLIRRNILFLLETSK